MPAGRPEKKIDWELVDRMLEANCSAKEIASHFGMYYQTFYEKIAEKYNTNFTNYAASKRESGLARLKLSQFEKAINNSSTGNVQMLIWLGKNLLGQKETVSTENSVNENTMSQFTALMKQISELQSPSGISFNSDLNIDEINIINEQKS